jgi:hypothetical protein
VAEAEPRRPVGVRLGLVEVRARLGEPLTDNEDAELQSFGALGSIAPLVLKVVRLLEVNESDAALRETLLSLYPLVQTRNTRQDVGAMALRQRLHSRRRSRSRRPPICRSSVKSPLRRAFSPG